MNGKQKCKILKEIRRQIAQENDIDLVIAECTHKGDCRGTCPRCEAEVRYLEQELEKRRQLQKRIALVGISAGVTLALSGCSAIESVFDTLGNAIHPKPTPQIEELSGMIEPLPTEDDFVLDGEVAPDDFCDRPSTTGLIAPDSSFDDF